MFNWTVISNISRGIANTTDSVRAESITMSPVMIEITLESKTSRGGMSQCRQVAVRAHIGWAILLVVAEKMTLKALHEGASRSRSEGVRAREYASGRGEYSSAIGEMNVLGSILRDQEGSIVQVC